MSHRVRRLYNYLDVRRRAASVAAPTSYDHTISSNADDGNYIVGFLWVTSGCTAADNGGSGVGEQEGDSIAGWSFPNVPLTTCSNAMLTLDRTEVVAGTIRIYGDDNDASASSQYSNSYFPVFNSNGPTTAFQAIATTTGSFGVNVTLIVQEIMGSAFYAAGGRINFSATAYSTGATCEFGHVHPTLGNVGTPARLQITA